MQILIPILFLVGVYMLLLRPQQQRVRRQRELITAIGVGDRVVTAGGLIGRVIDLQDDRLQLEIADGVVVELLRLAVTRRLDDSELGFAGVGDSTEDEYGEEEYAEDDEGGEEEEGGGGDGGEGDGGEGEGDGGEGDGGVDPDGGQGANTPGDDAAAVEAPAAGQAPSQTTPPTRSDGSIEGAAAPAPGQDPH